MKKTDSTCFQKESWMSQIIKQNVNIFTVALITHVKKFLKQSSSTVFSSCRQSKCIYYLPRLQFITSHWEVGANQPATSFPTVCPRHSGPLYVPHGPDQQPGDGADQPSVPAQLWSLSHPGLPGSWPLSAGCDYSDRHSYATGQDLWVYVRRIKNKSISSRSFKHYLPMLIIFAAAVSKPDCCCCFTGTTVQVHRYGLLLLQATPPHICVSDLGKRIGSIPGVQAVHDLHIWQLNESVMVASVHVHCHSGFPAHR